MSSSRKSKQFARSARRARTLFSLLPGLVALCCWASFSLHARGDTDYLNQILSTGQSLALGYISDPSIDSRLSLTQPYDNKMLSGTSLVPLVEINGWESPGSGMANTLSFLAAPQHFETVVTNHALSGIGYAGLKKGTAAYANGMAQLAVVHDAAVALGREHRVIGVTIIHGETDLLTGHQDDYQSYLEEWQHDYETDVRAVTGQTTPVRVFTDQMTSGTAWGYASNRVPLAQLAVAEEHPDQFVLVGPKYFLPYSDTVHLTGEGYRLLGEYYGKVMDEVVIDGDAWRPLSPDQIELDGNVITAKFHVPAGELVLDTTQVDFKTNYGFEYADSSSSAAITLVELVGSDTVRITLDATPTGSSPRLRYAFTGDVGAPAGPHSAGSARGNLRDTDPTLSLYGENLYDWAVVFDKPITLAVPEPMTGAMVLAGVASLIALPRPRRV